MKGGRCTGSPIHKKDERLCKASAETKFTWAMPSRRQRCIYMNPKSCGVFGVRLARLAQRLMTLRD